MVPVLISIFTAEDSGNYTKAYDSINGTTFFIKSLDSKIDGEFLENAGTDYPIPKSIQDGCYKNIYTLVPGVVFETEYGLLVVYRDENMTLHREYYKLKSGKRNTNPNIPFPLAMSNDINLINIDRAHNILNEVYKKNFSNIVTETMNKLEKTSKSINNFKEYTIKTLTRVEKEIKSLQTRDSDDREKIAYNLKIRKELLTELVTFESLLQVNDLLDRIYLIMSKRNENLTSNYKTLGFLYSSPKK